MRQKTTRKTIALTLASALGLGCVLSGQSLGGVSLARERSETQKALISQMLEGRDYIDGEAIVVMRGKEKPEGFRHKDEIARVSDETVEQALEESTSDVSDAAQGRVKSSDRSYTIQYISDHSKTTEEILEKLYEDPDVVSAEPNYKKQATYYDAGNAADTGENVGSSTFLGEDLTSQQWYCKKENSASMHTPKYPQNSTSYSLEVNGWDEASNKNSVGTVAVMDSGIDVTHPDLQDSLYHFTPEQQEKYKCGEYGINLTEGKASTFRDLTDTVGHGTHVAGIITGKWGDNNGISGVANGVKIIGVRNFDDGGAGSLAALSYGYAWLANIAEDVNLKAANVSQGGGALDLVETIMVNDLGEAGAVTVFASGNDSYNLDDTVDTGGTNNSPYAIKVNAADQAGKMASFSNYGQNATDVFAPGENILSTVPDIVYNYDSAKGGRIACIRQKGFFPEYTSSQDRSVYERFQNSSAIRFFKECPVDEKGNTVPGAVSTVLGSPKSGSGYGASDDRSWAIRVKDMSYYLTDDVTKYIEENNESLKAVYACKDLTWLRKDFFALYGFWMAIPVEQLNDPYWLGLKASSNNGKIGIFNSGIGGVLCDVRGSTEVKRIDLRYDENLQTEEVFTQPEEAETLGYAGLANASLTDNLFTTLSVDLSSWVKQMPFVHQKISSKVIKHLGDPGDISGLHIWEDGGKKYVLAQFGIGASMGLFDPANMADGKIDLSIYDVIDDQTELYIDDVCMANENGKTGAYQYMSGTSMAAPTVTGALSIIGKNEQNLSDIPVENRGSVALERKAKLLASVDYDKDLEKYSRTGGRVNLHGKSSFSAKAPIITDFFTDDGQLRLEGCFFEAKEDGKLYIDDTAFAVSSWSDQEITADISRLTNGQHTAKVQNADGAVTRISFSFTQPQLSLYEKSFDMRKLLNDPQFLKDEASKISEYMVSLNGCLYVLTADPYTAGIGDQANALWKYDTAKDEWSRCKDIPASFRMEERCLSQNPLAVMGGKIYFYGKQQFDEEGIPGTLGCYDPAKDSWTVYKFTKENITSSAIFSVANRMFMFKFNKKTKKIELHRVKLNTSTKTVSLINLGVLDERINSEFNNKVVVSGNTVYLSAFIDSFDYDTSDMLLRLKYNESTGKFTVQNDLTSELHKYFDDGVGTTQHMTMVGLPDGMAIINSSKLKAKTGSDTFIMRNDSSQFVRLERTSCYNQINHASGAYCGGYMYVLGINPAEPSRYFMRATEVGKVSLVQVSLKKSSLTYTGKQQTVGISGVSAGGTTLCSGDYTVSGNKGTNAGTYTVTVKAKSGTGYTGTARAKFTIKKGETSFKVKPSAKSVSSKRLKKGKQTIKMKVNSLSKGSSKPVFSIKSVSNGMKKKVSINKKTGTLTIKKGTGPCTIKVRAASAANKNRKAFAKTVTVKIK